MTEQNKTQKMAICAMLTALICVTTMLITIPSPLKGYLNLGDGVVLLAGWLLPPGYGFLAAGLGSALADIFSGYVMYAPATFVIKGLMALVASYGHKALMKSGNTLKSHLIPGFFAEVVMVLGYYIFEGFLYGFVPSMVNIPANSVQGMAGLVLGCVLIRLFERHKLTTMTK